MGLTLKAEFPAFPEGYEFAINGIGVVKNGEVTEISEEQERDFVAFWRMSVPDAFESQDCYTVEGDATVTAEDLPEISFMREPTQLNPDTAIEIADDAKLSQEADEDLAKTSSESQEG